MDRRADYSDNYFEMDAGAVRTVRVTLRDTEDLDSAALYIEGENVTRLVVNLAGL